MQGVLDVCILANVLDPKLHNTSFHKSDPHLDGRERELQSEFLEESLDILRPDLFLKWIESL